MPLSGEVVEKLARRAVQGRLARHVAMANLLADEELASEYIQDECTPEALALGMENLLTDPPRVALITRRYHEIHKQLQRDAARRSAYAVMKLIAGK